MSLLDTFSQRYGSTGNASHFFAPGRVNLIGEHIDYNGGYVFPATLTLGIQLIIRPRQDKTVNFYSNNMPGKPVSISLDKPVVYDDAHSWANYPKGVLAMLPAEGYPIPHGFDMLFEGNLPNGAGLSSSAAIEVVTTFALLTLLGHTPDKVWIAKFSQKVENRFVKVNCGIMDQFSVAVGEADRAILLDCQRLSYNHVPVILEDSQLIIMNTNKRRELADSKYNERRAECEEALRVINQYGSFEDLCSVDRNFVDRYLWNEPLYVRASHVVLENQRVLRAVTALQQGDLAQFGNLLIQSHQSLRTDYAVTGPELDAIVEEAVKQKGCLGARMTGAGFGGCALAIVENEYINEFKKNVAAAYTSRIGLKPDFYQSGIGPGVHQVG